MADIEALRVQEYSTNLQMLAQQKTPKVADYVMKQMASGNKAFRMMSQIDKTEATQRSTRAQPAINVDVSHDGRWVYPVMFDWGKVVDDIDLMQTNIQPQGMYVQSAVAAMNRKKDELFFSAFYGTAKTGEEGSTSTSFLSGNQIAHNYATTTSLTVEKLREAQRILLSNDVDLDNEPVYVAISPEQHDNLLGITAVTSADYAKPVLGMDGRIRDFLGMKFVISNLIPKDASGYRRVPVWTPSGMGCGIWKDISGVIRSRPDLQGDPAYVEASMMLNFTRLEEAKCVEIKCVE